MEKQKASEGKPQAVEGVVSRLQQAVGASTLSELAGKLGWDSGAVKSWNQRGSVPLAALIRAAEVANCSLDWLVRGVGPAPTEVYKLTNAPTSAHFSPPPAAEPAAAYRVTLLREGGSDLPVSGRISPDSGEPRPLVLSLALAPGKWVDYNVIPSIEGVAQAGPPDNNMPAPTQISVDVGGEMAFTGDWLRRHLGEHGPLASMRVSGDSMAPTVLDGETVIVDRGESTVGVSGVYVISLRGRRHLKRIQVRLDGSVVVMSDNPAYAAETLTAERAHDLQVIGRVIWPRAR